MRDSDRYPVALIYVLASSKDLKSCNSIREFETLKLDMGRLESSSSLDSLQDALFFFLVNTWPDEHYSDSTRTGLAISVASSAWASEIAGALDHPESL